MLKLSRSFENPILVPQSKNQWEASASFNPSVWKDSGDFKMVYRGVSPKKPYFETEICLSSIGFAKSQDPIHFTDRRQLILPEFNWEAYGCEDPRVTRIDDTYYIFYTALGGYPFGAENIRVALATTKDFVKIERKGLITPFNAKGACLFPEKVRNKYAVILTVDTEKPPSKIAIAYFDYLEDIWNPEIWRNWYSNIELYTIDLLRDSGHQVEVGAVPVKTKYGWLFIHSYIKDYLIPNHKFGIEAAILEADNPLKVLARTNEPLLVPREQYELFGEVPYTVFPSGAVVSDGDLYVYYGAADTVAAVASINLDHLISQMFLEDRSKKPTLGERVKFVRFDGNPIITPIKEHGWESKYVFNPAAICIENKVHLIYRAQGETNISHFGYARLKDGVHVDLRLDEPIYVPRISEEKDGCEDPRVTKIGNTLYMLYTAFHDGRTHIAMTTISVSDFLRKKFNWTLPQIISPENINDKNACVLPEKIKGKYILFHRTNHRIWVAEENSLDFSDGRWIQGNILFEPKEGTWYSEKVGITGPPIKTTEGWLLIFHGLSKEDAKYRFGAMLLDLNNPLEIKSMLDYPLLEPDTHYEQSGLRPGTVFSCGNVVFKDTIYIYYGAGDTSIGVAWVSLPKLLKTLSNNSAISI